jgi:signal transduction histidine kinase
VALGLLTLLPDRLQPLPDGIFGAPSAVLAVFGWAAGLWCLAAWLSNRVSALRERESMYRAESAVRMTELEESRKRIVGAQEALRKEAADALHGPVQSRLVLASHRIRQALKGASEEDMGRIQEAGALIDDVINMDLRVLIQHLHPSVIMLNTATALRSLADGYAGELDVNVDVDHVMLQEASVGTSSLPEAARLTLYRVAENALTNVLKHAGATRASIWLGMPTPGGVFLTIEDDGCGFDVESTPAGVGILTMQDYCGARGGALEIDSAVGRGTRVTAFVPLLPAPEARRPISEPGSEAHQPAARR